MFVFTTWVQVFSSCILNNQASDFQLRPKLFIIPLNECTKLNCLKLLHQNWFCKTKVPFNQDLPLFIIPQQLINLHNMRAQENLFRKFYFSSRYFYNTADCFPILHSKCQNTFLLKLYISICIWTCMTSNKHELPN